MPMPMNNFQLPQNSLPFKELVSLAVALLLLPSPACGESEARGRSRLGERVMQKKCISRLALSLTLFPQAGEGTCVDTYPFKGSAHASFPENGS